LPEGGDLPARARRRSGVRRRPVMLGAAAVILIAAGGIAFALTGTPHASASPPKTLAASITPPVTTTSAPPATTQPAPTATRTTHRPSASPSGRPNTQPTTHAPTTQAPTTQAPAPATSSAKPRPAPTHAPTHAATHPAQAGYTFSVSGASQLSCGAESSLQSASGASVQFSFVDDTSGNLQLAAISSSGAVVNSATLAPGVSFQTGTNVGAYWVIENSGGGCLVIYKIDGGGQVTIQ
jgi:hypothetical protein